jgi:hypothetical protein
MSPRPAKFRQIDVTRALRAAKAAGLEISKVEINADGGIVITNLVGYLPTVTEKSVVPNPSPVEKWKAKYGTPR